LALWRRRRHDEYPDIDRFLSASAGSVPGWLGYGAMPLAGNAI